MLYFGQLTDNQYVHSKFLAERHILEHVAAGKLRAKIMRAGNLSPRAEDGEFQMNMNSNAAMGRLRALKLIGACPYGVLEGQMEFTPIDQAAHAMVALARTPLANCVFNVSNNHFVPMDDVLTRLDKIDGKPLEYVEDGEFAERMKAIESKPCMTALLAPLVAYNQSASEQEGVETLASTVFTMQVLHRLGFRWNPTSSEYVDLIFEMLRTLRYFDV
jgi:nucleoside-diphosphate-sugar epimerase